MARPLRVEYPGAFYHVINRGNNQEKIFKNDRDKEKFLEYLETTSERFSVIFLSGRRDEKEVPQLKKLMGPQ